MYWSILAGRTILTHSTFIESPRCAFSCITFSQLAPIETVSATCRSADPNFLLSIWQPAAIYPLQPAIE